MSSFEEVLAAWGDLMRTKQPYTPMRLGMLGDGNGNVAVGVSLPGWSWIRYDSNPHKVATVLNRYEHWAEGTRVVVGKVHPNDPYEQVIGLDVAYYAQHMEDAWMAYMFAAPHGETHLSTETDPAHIDTGNVVDGRVRATNPVSMNVHVEPFLYPRSCLIIKFNGGTIDLTAYVPPIGLYGDLHRYVLIYMDIATGDLGVVEGDVYYTGFTPVVPDALENTVPLGIVLLTTGQTTIVTANIYPYKIIWHPLCENPSIHTHTDDSSGGASLLGIEELTFSAAVPLLVQMNRIYPTQVYHSLLVDPMYPVGSHDLHRIEPDPLFGEGQIIFLRLAQTMYGSYSVVLRHNLGNIYLAEGDITISKPTDHVFLMYNGTYWCPLKIVRPGGGPGGAPAGAQYVVMALHGSLPNERVLTAGAHLQLVDGGAGGAATLNVLTTTGAAASTVLNTDVLSGIRPSRIGLGCAVPDQAGAIALLETADPTNAANVGMFYVKNKAGITVAYLRRDDGDVMEIAHVIDGVTKTVKAAGGDFTAVQAAVDWFKGPILIGDSIIDVDPGAYDEAIVFENILVAPGATLTLRGDVRDLAGLSFVDGCDINKEGLTNGGSGVGTLANAAAVVTITGAGGNPDFDADGWGNGDAALIFDNGGATNEYGINSTLNATITLAVAAPAIGNDSTVVCLLPDRRIERTVSGAGPCIEVVGCRGIQISGFYLVSATGDDCHGIYVRRGAEVRIDHVACKVDDYGIHLREDSFVECPEGAMSVLDSGRGIGCAYMSYIDAQWVVMCDCLYGCLINNTSYAFLRYCIAVNIVNYGYYAAYMGSMDVLGAWARKCVNTGYKGIRRAYIFALSTNIHNSVNGANYSPIASDAWGNNNASITWS